MEEKMKMAAEAAAEAESRAAEKNEKVSETWAQEIIEDLDDFIESQGIYLRQ